MALPGNHNIWKQKESSPGGIEPPTFRLTAERADRLRHGDCAKSGLEIRRKATLLKCGKFKSWLEDFFFFLLPLCISNSTLQVCYRNCILYYILLFAHIWTHKPLMVSHISRARLSKADWLLIKGQKNDHCLLWLLYHDRKHSTEFNLFWWKYLPITSNLLFNI